MQLVQGRMFFHKAQNVALSFIHLVSGTYVHIYGMVWFGIVPYRTSTFNGRSEMCECY